MKPCLTLLLFITTSLNLVAQLGSINVYTGVSLSNGYNESFYTNLNFDVEFDAKLSCELGMVTSFQISKDFKLFTGIDFSMYRYAPLTNVVWPSNAYENKLGRIGFNSNGLIENYYLSIPIGVTKTISFSSLDIIPSFYTRVNYTVSRSPLWNRENGYRKSFLLAGVSIGFNLVKMPSSRISVHTYLEMEPKSDLSDHSFSDENLIKIGLRLMYSIDTCRNKTKVIDEVIIN